MIADPLVEWLDRRRAASGLRVTPISLADCHEWAMKAGELRHRTGRYFQIIGAQVTSGPYEGWRQPVIRQDEIGILGFLTRQRAGGTEWLAQAKTEPGNVGGTQIGPTVQATESNYEQVHRGAPTRYLAHFLSQDGAPTVLASEQGTRFLGKRNRNVVVDADARPADHATGEVWRWLTSEQHRRALATDFMMNTDARSVVVSAPWSLIAESGKPFARWKGTSGFGGRLAASYEADPDVRLLSWHWTTRVLRQLSGRWTRCP